MNQLLTEFISYIVAERTVRSPGKHWNTPRGWYAKSPSGGRARFFGNTKNSKKNAQLYATGQSGGAPAQKVNPEPRQRARGSEPAATRTTATPASSGRGRTAAKTAEVPSGKTPAEPIKPKYVARDSQILQSTIAVMEKRGFASGDDKKRFYAFMGFWKAFIDAPTYEQQVKAVKALADHNFIQRSPNGKKIYATAITGLIPKHMCSASGDDTVITRLMNKIIEKESITVPLRGGSADRALAAVSGKHNEAGVTRYLFGNEENIQKYEMVTARYQSLGGDPVIADERNRTAAEAIVKVLPKGAKITNATEVGSAGANILNQLGIIPKVDPTDILLEYEVGKKRYIMKISAKIYTNPRNITMKNAGIKEAGVEYLGESFGVEVDAEWKELWKKYKWNDTMTEQEKVTRKSALRQSYLKLFSSKMEKLARTKDGQAQLLKMWQDVHGCGRNVYTLVISKVTNKAEVRDPGYYCNPDVPFKVKYDGIKVVIEMRTGGPQTLQIDMKTEDKGTPKLLFRHIIRGKN